MTSPYQSQMSQLEQEFASYSPTLADRVTLNTPFKSIESITKVLMDFVQEQ